MPQLRRSDFLADLLSERQDLGTAHDADGPVEFAHFVLFELAVDFPQHGNILRIVADGNRPIDQFFPFAGRAFAVLPPVLQQRLHAGRVAEQGGQIGGAGGGFRVRVAQQRADVFERQSLRRLRHDRRSRLLRTAVNRGVGQAIEIDALVQVPEFADAVNQVDHRHPLAGDVRAVHRFQRELAGFGAGSRQQLDLESIGAERIAQL